MITYLKGDATQPMPNGGVQLITHICNDEGGWGSGFVLAVSKRWEEPELLYRKASADGRAKLGFVQTVWVGPRLAVVNMVAQDGFVRPGRPRAVVYDVLEHCLGQVARVASRLYASVHMPRIGCGLAGGSWDVVAPLIESTIGATSRTEVFVYDLPGDYSK